MTDSVELFLLRHADAGDPEAWRGDDAERPLSPKGEKQAKALAKFLAKRGFTADKIVTSPKVRARQTADAVAEALGLKVTVDDRLAGLDDLGDLDSVVREAAGHRVVVVGHDPDFSDLAAELTGAHELPVKKGALLRIDAGMPLRTGTGTLRWMVPPDLLG